MRRLLLGITLFVVTVEQTAAQQIVMRDGPDRGRIAKVEEHLEFRYTPIDGSIEDFVRILNNKNYSVTGERYVEGERKAGSYGGVDFDGLIILCDYQHNKVYGLSLITHMASWSGAMKAFADMDAHLKKAYPTAICWEYTDWDDNSDENVYTIKDIGTIKLSYTMDRHTIEVNFTDRINHELAKGPSTEKQWYDIKSYIPSYSECYMGVSDEEIMFILNNSGQYYALSARGNDKYGINYLINNSTDESTIKEVLGLYVKQSVDRNITYNTYKTYIYHNSLQPICKQINEERAKKTQTRQNSNVKSGRNMFLDFIIDQVFSKSDQKYFEKLIGRDGMRKITGAGIGIATGKGVGNGMLSCGSCGASFSSQADLRAHENAYHDY